MKNIWIILIGMSFVMSSCSVDETEPISVELLIGEWDATEYAQYRNLEEPVYTQQFPVEILEKDGQGLSLMENGNFCHRHHDKIIGWQTCSGNTSSGSWTFDKQDNMIIFNIQPDNIVVEADIIDYTENSLWLRYYLEPHFFEYKLRRH